MASEVLIFFQAVGIGAVLGIGYDLFRILRLAFPRGKVLIFFEDVIYFAFVSICSFSFILTQTNGILRAFILFGELLGATIYFFTIGCLVMKAAGAIIRIIEKLFRLLYKVFVRPILRLFRWIGRYFIKFGIAAKNFGKKFFCYNKKDLKPPTDLVYTKDDIISHEKNLTQKRKRSRQLWRRNHSGIIKSEIQGS